MNRWLIFNRLQSIRIFGKEKLNMNDFIVLQQNGLSNLAFMITGNGYLLLLLIGVLGVMWLLVKEELDEAIREEQNII